ncbi:hypothetical protein ABIA30_002528 [Mycobacterium sp. MAA66]|uniref:beta-galactosidase n=1 Tax=Mycobacterium sp. MAA66 TaxID=3156297 RepID=UPI0035161B65
MRHNMRRLILRRAVVACSAAIALACTFGSFDPQPVSRTYDVTPTASIVESSDTLGLADSNLLRLNSDAEIDKELDMMQSIGIQDIRIGLFWSQIEPLQGVFNWTKADYIIDQANKRGMGVLAVLNETPAWAGTPIGSGTPDTADYAAYAQAVAQRYAGKVSAVEVWNEPNAAFFLNPVSPANYTALLKAAYTAIKSVDPSMTVIGGVLGSGRTIGNITMNPIQFLQGMYAAGAQGYFDALSFHPYKYDIPFSQQGNQKDSPLLQLEELRSLMDANGDGAKQIWATEYGLPTPPTGANAGITQTQQAEYILDFLNTWSQIAGNGPMFIYSTRDLNTGAPGDGNNFGIWETNWTPKLAVQTIADWLTMNPGPGQPPPTFLERLRVAIDNALLWVGNAIQNVVSWIATAAVNIANAVITGVKLVVKAGVAVAQAIGRVIGNAITATVNAIKNVIDRIFNRNGAAAVASISSRAPRAAAAAKPVATSALTSTVAAAAAKNPHRAPVAAASPPTATALPATDKTDTGTAGSGRKGRASARPTAGSPTAQSPSPTAKSKSPAASKTGKGSATPAHAE